MGRKAGQKFGVIAVVLGLAAGERGDLASVGHDHLLAKIFEQPAGPGRVRAALQRDAKTSLALEMLPESALRVLDPPFLHHFALLVQQTVLAVTIA